LLRHALALLAVPVAGLLLASPSLAAPPQIQSERVVTKRGATVDLDVATSDSRLRVLRREGVTLQPLPDAVKSSARLPTRVSIPNGAAVMIRNESSTPAAPAPLTSVETALNAVLVESVPVAGAATVEVRQWTLLISASQVPLVWNAAKHAYTTELLVRLRELGQAQGRKPSSPITVQLVGKGVAVEPQTLQLSEAGVGGIQRALVSLTNHRAKGTVEAISDFGEQSYEVDADAQLASLDLASTLTAIPGFGIGTTQISAVRRAEDGRELASALPLSIMLTASGGRLAAPSLLIPASGTHSAPIELRSSWIGEAALRASVDGVDASPLSVSFSTPWSYLVAILLGAAVGSYVRVRPRLKASYSELYAGMGVGLILGLGSFIGISSFGGLPATAVVTELGCFVVAAIEAYLGRAALDRFGSTSPPRDEPQTGVRA
jgi:hypothetical protein